MIWIPRLTSLRFFFGEAAENLFIQAGLVVVTCCRCSKTADYIGFHDWMLIHLSILHIYIIYVYIYNTKLYVSMYCFQFEKPNISDTLGVFSSAWLAILFPPPGWQAGARGQGRMNFSRDVWVVFWKMIWRCFLKGFEQLFRKKFIQLTVLIYKSLCFLFLSLSLSFAFWW